MSYSWGEVNFILTLLSADISSDAAHSMVPHIGQGAATSIEDGVFLARTLTDVIGGRLSLAQAINIYEKARMPLAHYKQQISFINGQVWQLPDGPLQRARDEAMASELRGEAPLRSPNLWQDPFTALTVFGYDAEHDAEIAIQAHHDGQEPRDDQTALTRREMDRYFGYWWPSQVARTPTPAATAAKL